METLIDIVNVVCVLMIIALGVTAWFAPRFTMGKLDLETAGSDMGVSEVRAASGALFVGLGIGAFLLGEPAGYAMAGFAILGASVGRITSIALDDGTTKRTWGFFAWEIVVGGLLLALNWPF
ncbi:MAG: DUF4345 family protein [Hasllibacter sp.]